MDTFFLWDLALLLLKCCQTSSARGDPLHILAVLGRTGSRTKPDEAEIINLGSSNSSCTSTNPPPYPYRMFGATGVFLDGKARICGGPGLAKCFEWAVGEEEWTLSDYSLSKERYRAESFLLSNGSWLVVGGSSGYSTDIYFNGTMEKGPSLPEYFSHPTGAVVNSSHIWLQGYYPWDESYLINVDNWELTKMPIMRQKRDFPSCGMVTNDDGERELVVGGGIHSPDYVMATTEIFNFGTMEWREGPRLPVGVAYAETVQMSKTFLIMGGYSYDQEDATEHFLDTIYEFDSVNYEWIERDQRLETPRDYFVAIPLPNDPC